MNALLVVLAAHQPHEATQDRSSAVVVVVLAAVMVGNTSWQRSRLRLQGQAHVDQQDR